MEHLVSVQALVVRAPCCLVAPVGQTQLSSAPPTPRRWLLGPGAWWGWGRGQGSGPGEGSHLSSGWCQLPARLLPSGLGDREPRQTEELQWPGLLGVGPRPGQERLQVKEPTPKSLGQAFPFSKAVSHAGPPTLQTQPHLGSQAGQALPYKQKSHLWVLRCATLRMGCWQAQSGERKTNRQRRMAP